MNGVGKWLFLMVLGIASQDLICLDVKPPISAAQQLLQKRMETALSKGERKTMAALFADIAKKSSAYAAAVAAYAAAVNINNPNSFSLSDVPHFLAVGALLGAPGELIKQYKAAPPGWLDQIKQLNVHNVSEKTVNIAGEHYLLSKLFDKTEAAGYGPTSYKQGDSEHYVFEFVPPVNKMVTFFFDLEDWFNKKENNEVGDKIAFIALRPTPSLYRYGYGSGIFSSGEAMARIVIGLKSQRDVADAVKKNSAQEVLFALVDFLVPADSSLSGSFPESKDKLFYAEQLGAITFVRFGSRHYRKNHPEEFESHKKYVWFGSLPNDMAYPRGREKALQLPTIEKVLNSKEYRDHVVQKATLGKRVQSPESAVEQELKVESKILWPPLYPVLERVPIPPAPPSQPILHSETIAKDIEMDLFSAERALKPTPPLPQADQSMERYAPVPQQRVPVSPTLVPQPSPKSLSTMLMEKKELRSGATITEMINDINDLYALYEETPKNSDLQKRTLELKKRVADIRAKGGETIRQQLEKTEDGRDALQKLDVMTRSPKESEGLRTELLSVVPISEVEQLIDDVELLAEELKKAGGYMTQAEKTRDSDVLGDLLASFEDHKKAVTQDQQTRFSKAAEQALNALKNAAIY
jgi:hypothetical protein